jgi:Cell division GTPase
MVNVTVAQPQELQPRIIVFGVGGAGGNAVNNMIRSDLQGVEFVVANTDAQALSMSESQQRIQLGREVTQVWVQVQSPR